MNRTIAVVIAALVAVLAAVGLLTGGEGSDSEPSARSAGPSIAQVARGVERVRELKFERLPRVERVTGEQAAAAGLRELDRDLPRADVLAEERLLKLLHLLPPKSGLRELLGKALSTEVGGYYLPRTRTLSIVGGGGQLGLLGEITLAHELTHALEDQHFGIESRGSTGFRRDREVADSALREGSATVAMVDYAVLEETGTANVPAQLRGRALRALDDAAVPASSGLPRYVRESLVFPYAAGARLVNRIQGRGGWEAVNRAFGADAPVSSEQVMHPAKYDARERPVRVRVTGLRSALPAGARPVEEGDFGEFDTEQLLRAANGRERSAAAAAGWGGGGFSLWRLGTDRYALALRWAWDSARDAREFERAARRTARSLGGAAVARRGRTVALALAPERARAEALVQRALPE
ncbi:MAG: hypothetical protein QOD71_3587 [Thermoleophilaceae bacterium]|jgi:hypothetical protein|nr:hypothetical protein [Thermoleophilaceae bacterium]